jgi:uncharacterized protein with ParB-like and HNH nuclease domain
LTIDSIRIEFSAKRKYDPEKWDINTGRMIGKTQSYKLFNAYLDTLYQKAFETKRKLIEIDKPLTAENIKVLLLGKSINNQKAENGYISKDIYCLLP